MSIVFFCWIFVYYYYRVLVTPHLGHAFNISSAGIAAVDCAASGSSISRMEAPLCCHRECNVAGSSGQPRLREVVGSRVQYRVFASVRLD